jgi:hypothetical protein
MMYSGMLRLVVSQELDDVSEVLAAASIRAMSTSETSSNV